MQRASLRAGPSKAGAVVSSPHPAKVEAAAIVQRTAADASTAGSQPVQSTDACSRLLAGLLLLPPPDKHSKFGQQQAQRAAQDAAVINEWERALQQAQLDSAEATVLRRAAFHACQRNADAEARAGHL